MRNTMNKVAVIISLILAMAVVAGAVSCGGRLAPVSTVPYTDVYITVEPFTTQSKLVLMAKGSILEGYLTVRGGNDDIVFYIEDLRYENKLFFGDRVYGLEHFYYQAPHDGGYAMCFDNSFSWITSKRVHIHYRVR